MAACDLAAVVRVAYDPVAVDDLDEQRAHGDPAPISWDEAGPVAATEASSAGTSPARPSRARSTSPSSDLTSGPVARSTAPAVPCRAGSATSCWTRTGATSWANFARSGASERHAFILVPALTSAPFGVVDMLWRDEDDVVPTAAPDLPDQVTHVWLMAV